MASIDEIYDQINDDLEYEIPDNLESEIQKFYANKTLFITGATGFMGRCLVAKLLRCCPDIKHIYIMMRQRKGVLVQEQLNKYFKNMIFGPLRSQYPDFEQKVTAMKGDLLVENLGLSNEDQDTVKKEANIILHNAANVKFDIKVNLSLKVNVLGTKCVLELAQECEKLELFMYISTAYSHCGDRKHLEEKFYPPPADLQVVHDMIQADLENESGLSADALKMLIGNHPNIYTFTKAISEDLVRQFSKKSKVSVAVYRPSVVVSSWKEPLAGWICNYNGPVCIILGSGLGLFHSSYHHGYPIDLVPVDLTINALIAVSWDVHKRWKIEEEAVVYNYGSSTTNPITLPMLNDFAKHERDSERSGKAVFMNFVIFTSHNWCFWILHLLFHLLPACLADIALMVSGRKPMAVSIWWKVTGHLDGIDYFGNGDWRIEMPETLKVVDKLNAVDKELFYCDIREFSWEPFMLRLWRGYRVFLLKESINSTAGFERYKLIFIAYYGLIAMTLFIFYFYSMKLYNAFFA